MEISYWQGNNNELKSLHFLKITIIYSKIFHDFALKICVASTKFCNLYAKTVQGQQILMLYTTIVHIILYR